MSWVSALMLAAAASMDCFIIGFNYGVKGVRIGNTSNAFMALICFCGTFLSMLLGRFVGAALDPAWGTGAGGLLFVLLGLWMLRGALPQRRKAMRQQYSQHPEMVDKDASNVIELRESCMIGLLLCINNIGIGIGGGISGISLIATPAACALLSFLFIRAGCSVGKIMENSRLSVWLEAISGLLILLLGLWELLGLLC